MEVHACTTRASGLSKGASSSSGRRDATASPRAHHQPVPAVLRARRARRWRGHDHRPVRRRQGDLLQALPAQGRPCRVLSGQGRPGLVRAAARRCARQLTTLVPSSSRCSTRSPRRAAAMALGGAFINAAAESHSGGDVHARTIEHKGVVRAWIRDLARRAGAADPDLLARRLTLLIDGGLADGVLAPTRPPRTPPRPRPRPLSTRPARAR